MKPLAHAPGGAPSADTGANRLLARLGAADLRMLEPLELVRLPARHSLFDAGDAIRYLYFPAGAVVSLVQPDHLGATPEIAHIGAEGLVGVDALLGAGQASRRAVVRVGGFAHRLPLYRAQAAFAHSTAFQAQVLRFAELMIRQLAQNVFCKLSHGVEQQFCQRLLLYALRGGGAALEMTHEQMAEALGSRRQGVTEAARRLQRRGAIAYSRGRISVLDPALVERSACECYGVLRDAIAL